MTDILRELLGPMLPEGVSYDDLYPLTEALAKPGPLASDRTARRERRPPPEADEYRRLLKRQERLRGTYRNELRKLLKLAEEEGPTYQTKALKKFSQLAKRFMTDAHQLGMKLSLKTPPKGPDMVAQNYIKERVNHDRSHFTDFLQAIWGGTEHMKRAHRRDLYVNALDSMFVQGAIAGQADDVLISWKLSPAEHCRDCLALAAYAPYVKPGVKSKHPELPTIPRRGDTQCLSRCKCYLTYKHGITGEPVDPQPRPGFRPEPREDGEPVPVVPDPLQKELDKLHADMLYFRTQYEITQDEAWLKMRREANKRVIEIQDALGARLVPGVEADYMVKQVAQAVKDGWEPAVAANDARRFARSQVVGAAKGTEFYRGTLTSWDQKRGEGKMMDISGQEIVVGTDPKHSTVMMSRGASTPDRPWRVPRDGDETFSTTFKNSTSSYRTNLPETVDDASMIKTINSVIESRPKEETHNTHFVVRQGTKSSRQVVVDKDKTANIIHTVGGNPQKLTITEKNVRQSVALTIKKRLDEIPAFQAKWNAAIQRVALMKTKKRYVGGATSPLDEYTDFLNDFVQDVKYDDAEFAKAYDLFVAEPEVLKREVPDIFSVMSEALGYLKEFEGFSIFKGSSDDLVNEFGEDE